MFDNNSFFMKTWVLKKFILSSSRWR